MGLEKSIVPLKPNGLNDTIQAYELGEAGNGTWLAWKPSEILLAKELGIDLQLVEQLLQEFQLPFNVVFLRAIYNKPEQEVHVNGKVTSNGEATVTATSSKMIKPESGFVYFYDEGKVNVCVNFQGLYEWVQSNYQESKVFAHYVDQLNLAFYKFIPELIELRRTTEPHPDDPNELLKQNIAESIEHAYIIQAGNAFGMLSAQILRVLAVHDFHFSSEAQSEMLLQLLLILIILPILITVSVAVTAYTMTLSKPETKKAMGIPEGDRFNEWEYIMQFILVDLLTNGTKAAIF